jgi:hypothetical protein
VTEEFKSNIRKYSLFGTDTEVSRKPAANTKIAGAIIIFATAEATFKHCGLVKQREIID